MPKNNEDVCSRAPLQDMEGIYKFWVFDTFESITAYALERYTHKSNIAQVIKRLCELNQMCIEEDDSEPIILESLRNFLAYFCYIDNCPRPSLTVSNGCIHASWKFESTLNFSFSTEQEQPVDFVVLRKHAMEGSKRIFSGHCHVADALQFLTVDGDVMGKCK